MTKSKLLSAHKQAMRAESHTKMLRNLKMQGVGTLKIENLVKKLGNEARSNKQKGGGRNSKDIAREMNRAISDSIMEEKTLRRKRNAMRIRFENSCNNESEIKREMNKIHNIVNKERHKITEMYDTKVKRLAKQFSDCN